MKIHVELLKIMKRIHYCGERHTYTSKTLPKVSDLSLRKHFVRSSVFSPLRVPCQNKGTIHTKNSCDNGLAPLRGFLFSGFLPESMTTRPQSLLRKNKITNRIRTQWWQMEMNGDSCDAILCSSILVNMLRLIFVGHYRVLHSLHTTTSSYFFSPS